MGAKAESNAIQITDDYCAFSDQTGIFLTSIELAFLGFQRDCFSGFFRSPELPAILAFCKENPSYHIISVTEPGRYENRYVSGKQLYFLGDGDTNPNLVLNLFLKKSPELFAEEGLAEALAMIDKIDVSGQT